MKNYQPRLYDVKVADLERLDAFAKDPSKLESALGTKADGQMDETRFLDAARVLYGQVMEQTLDMLKEGQPGYLYVQCRRALINAIRMPRNNDVRRTERDDAISPLAKTTIDISEEVRAEQPPQPL